MFPMEQGLNTVSPALDTGLMMNCAPESQVLFERGQHAELPVHPDVQSCYKIHGKTQAQA